MATARPQHTHRRYDIDALMAAFQREGDAAFAPLHAAARDMMSRYLFTRGMPHGVIEDAVAAAAVKVYVHSAAYDPARARASTWMCTIARNEALQILRRAAARQVDHHADVSLVADLEDAPGERAVPDEDYARLLRRVVAWMRQRPHEHREHLMRIGGASYAEIIAATGDNHNTVATRIRRSRQKCARAFGEDYARMMAEE